jgi:4-diphosphocytidyl-2-C-methyl-D-erythritol kinase
MVVFPKAKINIGLYITGKRPDGFHNLQTIFYPVCLCDALEFVVAGRNLSSDEFTSSGIPLDCAPQDNLVMKALQKIRERFEIPILRIHLHKVIPSGAGLGGGSSDGAALIRGLNRYFDLGLSTEEMKEIALTLGSDCPFFIDSSPVFAEGRGELHTPVNPVGEGWYLVLVKPGDEISTREAYKGAVPVMRDPDLPLHFSAGVESWKDLISNDFEKTVFPGHPAIASIKDQLYRSGAVYSSMSGSGSAVYGIFRNKPEIPGSISMDTIYSGFL